MSAVMPSIRGSGRSGSSDRRSRQKNLSSIVITGYKPFKAELPPLRPVCQDVNPAQASLMVGGKPITKSLSISTSRGRDFGYEVTNMTLNSFTPLAKSRRSLSHPRQHGIKETSSAISLSLPSEKKSRPQSFHKDVREANEHDLMCPICLEILYRPRELVCGHRFCLTCLQSYSNSCWKNISCPSCRHSIELPPNGVLDLPRNWRLEKATERFREQKHILSNRAQICFNCHSDDDIIGCGHCGKGWCYLCRPSHSEEVKLEFLKLREGLKETKESIICRKEEDENRFNKLEQKIYEAIEHKKEELTSQVHKMRERSQNKVSRLFDEIDDTLISSALLPASKLTFEEVGKRHNQVNLLLTEVLASIEPRLTFDCASLTLCTFDGASSNDVVANKQSSEDEELELREDDDDDHLIIPKDHSSLYRKKSSYSKHKWGNNICCRPAGIAVSPKTGHVYVTASDSCKIYIYDQSGKQLSSFGCRGHKDGHFLCPIGIAFSLVENELYITDKWKHCIHVFDSEGRFLRQVGRKGKGFGEFSSPEGIATDSHGNIYVADTCNDRVQILDSDGVYLCEVGVVSSEVLGYGRRYTKREFSEPVGVAVSLDGNRIYVADSGNHRIRVFNGHTGERLLIFGSRGYNKGQFESPECIAIDEKGFIIVGDSGNGRVQIFRPNGHFVRVLGSKNNRKGEFGWVSGIALTKNNEILVTDFKNNTIAVF